MKVIPLPKTRRSIFRETVDYDVAVLGEYGWTTKAISRETGLSEGQVAYRLHYAGIKRADYRNGTSATAQLVMEVTRPEVRQSVNDVILQRFEEEYFKEPQRIRKDQMSQKLVRR